MMRALAVTAGLWVAATPSQATQATAQPASARATGFLDAAQISALARAVPPGPGANSAADRADRAASEGWRAFEDSDRWMLATAHAELRPPVALSHFDCALGVRFGSAETPALTRLFARVLADADAVAERVKAQSHRPRPVADPERRACQRLSDAARASASYPSGSATVGAAQAEILAALAPDAGEALRETGRQIGVSRLVCGMHYDSDVAAGAALGRRVAAVVIDSVDFQRMRTEAEAEIAAARASGQVSAACPAERAAFARTPG